MQREIDNLLIKMKIKNKDEDKPWAVGISLLFLSIEYSFGINIKRKNYLALLKDIVTHRKEMNSSRQHLKRLFKVDVI